MSQTQFKTEKIESELENLLLDFDGIEEIESGLGGFNIFDAIGQFRREELHSNFLAFFLDPSNSHELGAEFLSRFIVESIRSKKRSFQRIPLSKVAVMDFEKTRVYREYGLGEDGRIDILCVDESNKFFLAVENKIDAEESSGQLEKYRKALCKIYGGYIGIFVYLTSDGRKPFGNEWLPVSYEIVHSVALAVIDKVKRGVGEEVATALGHYASMLRRHIVGDEKLEEIALTFYQKHKEAIDYVSNLVPDVQHEIMKLIDNVVSNFEKESEITIVRRTKSLINFAPTSWENIFCSELKKKWTPSNYSLLFEIKVNTTIINLRLFVGPMKDQVLRSKIVQFASKNLETFGNSPPNRDSEYTFIYSKLMVDKSTLYEQDLSKIGTTFEEKFYEFVKCDFEKMSNQLIQKFGNHNTA